MPRIGQKVVCKPESFNPGERLGRAGEEGSSGGWNRKYLTGIITYIHPRGRFIVAEFKLPGGTVRECFKMNEVQYGK